MTIKKGQVEGMGDQYRQFREKRAHQAIIDLQENPISLSARIFIESNRRIFQAEA